MHTPAILRVKLIPIDFRDWAEQIPQEEEARRWTAKKDGSWWYIGDKLDLNVGPVAPPKGASAVGMPGKPRKTPPTKVDPQVREKEFLMEFAKPVELVSQLYASEMEARRLGFTRPTVASVPILGTPQTEYSTQRVERILNSPPRNKGVMILTVAGTGKSAARRWFRHLGFDVIEPRDLPITYRSPVIYDLLADRGFIILTNSPEDIIPRCLKVYPSLNRAFANLKFRRDRNANLTRRQAIEMMNRTWAPFNEDPNRVFLPDSCFISDVIWSLFLYYNVIERMKRQCVARSQRV